MRPVGVLPLALCLSALSPLASAWPTWLPDLDSLVVRADDPPNSTQTADSSATPTPTATDDGGDMNTAQPPSGTQSVATVSIGPNDYAGGVNMLSPPPTLAPTPLFMISQYATFSWNYTSLKAPPKAIDVIASCSQAQDEWTLTSNMTFATDVSFVWNTNDQANDVEKPLPAELYTLIVKDSSVEVTAAPEPGKLGAFSQFTFGLYQGAKATPLDEFVCAACNAAVPGFDSRALGFAVTMSALTVLSFTWFVTGL